MNIMTMMDLKKCSAVTIQRLWFLQSRFLLTRSRLLYKKTEKKRLKDKYEHVSCRHRKNKAVDEDRYERNFRNGSWKCAGFCSLSELTLSFKPGEPCQKKSNNRCLNQVWNEASEKMRNHAFRFKPKKSAESCFYFWNWNNEAYWNTQKRTEREIQAPGWKRKMIWSKKPGEWKKETQWESHQYIHLYSDAFHFFIFHTYNYNTLFLIWHKKNIIKKESALFLTTIIQMW